MSDTKPIPFRIEILCEGPNDFAVVFDDQIVQKMTWDEMLGQVASLTLTGTPRFWSHREKVGGLIDRKRRCTRDDLIFPKAIHNEGLDADPVPETPNRLAPEIPF